MVAAVADPEGIAAHGGGGAGQGERGVERGYRKQHSNVGGSRSAAAASGEGT